MYSKAVQCSFNSTFHFFYANCDNFGENSTNLWLNLSPIAKTHRRTYGQNFFSFKRTDMPKADLPASGVGISWDSLSLSIYFRRLGNCSDKLKTKRLSPSAVGDANSNQTNSTRCPDGAFSWPSRPPLNLPIVVSNPSTGQPYKASTIVIYDTT